MFDLGIIIVNNFVIYNVLGYSNVNNNLPELIMKASWYFNILD